MFKLEHNCVLPGVGGNRLRGVELDECRNVGTKIAGRKKGVESRISRLALVGSECQLGGRADRSGGEIPRPAHLSAVASVSDCSDRQQVFLSRVASATSNLLLRLCGIPLQKLQKRKQVDVPLRRSPPSSLAAGSKICKSFLPATGPSAAFTALEFGRKLAVETNCRCRIRIEDCVEYGCGGFAMERQRSPCHFGAEPHRGKKGRCANPVFCLWLAPGTIAAPTMNGRFTCAPPRSFLPCFHRPF